MPNALRRRSKALVPVAVTTRALAPALPRPVPLVSAVARELRERGLIICTGVVTGWTSQPGQSFAALSIDAPALTAATQTAGMAAVTLNLDREAARYLPPNARVRVAIEVMEEDDTDGD